MRSGFQNGFAVESLSAVVAKEAGRSYLFVAGFVVLTEVWQVAAALLTLAACSEVLAASVVAAQSAAVADFESFVGDQTPEAAAWELCSAAANANP